MCIAVGGLLLILNTILCTPLIKRRQKQQTTTHLIEEHTSTTMDGMKVTPAQFVGEQERVVLQSLWVRHVFRGVQPGLCA